MRKEIEFTLDYIQNGERKAHIFRIDFVPNIRHRQYAAIVNTVQQVKSIWDKVNYCNAEIAAILTEKPEGWKARKREKEEEIKKLSLEAMQLGNEHFFVNRANLVISILKDNGVEDETFLTPDFWETSVDPASVMDLLQAAIYKDITDKKKLTAQK